jgi:hypothetical protein
MTVAGGRERWLFGILPLFVSIGAVSRGCVMRGLRRFGLVLPPLLRRLSLRCSEGDVTRMESARPTNPFTFH